MIYIGPGIQHLEAWGWEAHRYINEHAVDCLPSEMANFKAQRDYLRQHSVDPDQSGLPGYYHYIDIDYYPEFTQGTMPHNFDTLVTHYGYNTVTNNGTVPWVIAEWADSLTHLMQRQEWNSAWQIAAELGHFIADSHQPLHLTMNYNGQNTGNYGIHSRYESSMINPHLQELTPPDSMAHYWSNPIDSVFQYIDIVYPYVENIMAADDEASSQDDSYGLTYYTLLWDQLDSLTTDAINRSILDLANIWYTAWINAGSPTELTNDDLQQPMSFSLHQNYPNPFNPVTTIRYGLPQDAPVQLVIFDLSGREVWRQSQVMQSAGWHQIQWNGQNQLGQQVSTGEFFYRLQAGDYVGVKKMVLMK